MTVSDKMSAKTKIRNGFIAILTGVLIFISLFIYFTKSIDIHEEETSKFINTMIKLKEIETLQNDQRALVVELAFNNDKAEIRKSEKNIQLQYDSLKHIIDKIEKGLAKYPELIQSIKDMDGSLANYQNTTIRTLSKIEEGGDEQAIQKLLDTQSQVSNELDLQLKKFEAVITNSIKALNDENITFIFYIKVAMWLLAIIMVLGITYLMYRILLLVKNLSEELKTGVSIIGESSSEILTTVTEISTGAAETAAAVSETTTTIEEVRQTSIVSNQKAQSLLNTSQKAADAAEGGKNSVFLVIEAMKKIDHQMSIISETVVKLSDQNRTIGEITSTVSDIADQSNLLAVNAAIEAVKAGDHGRGFSVVAQEIRVLANQSKKATTQVKDILNEINKSVQQAVSVTNEGLKAVEESRTFVSQSGDAIEVLSDNVEDAAQAAVQISSSSQQQMAGMEQIVPAMENIKHASEQNLKGIKQAQNVAHDMSKLGQTLHNIIVKYNL